MMPHWRERDRRFLFSQEFERSFVPEPRAVDWQAKLPVADCIDAASKDTNHSVDENSVA